MHSDRLCLFKLRSHKRRPLTGVWGWLHPHVKLNATRAQRFVTTFAAPLAWHFIRRVGDSFTKAQRLLRALVNRFSRALRAHARTRARTRVL